VFVDDHGNKFPETLKQTDAMDLARFGLGDKHKDVAVEEGW